MFIANSGQALDPVHAAVLPVSRQLHHAGGCGQQERGVRAHQENKHYRATGQ